MTGDVVDRRALAIANSYVGKLDHVRAHKVSSQSVLNIGSSNSTRCHAGREKRLAAMLG